MHLESHFLTSSYMDVFPRNRLVYLSPDAKESLKTYNHDDIYIVGAYLDKSSLHNPVSYQKATKDGKIDSKFDIT